MSVLYAVTATVTSTPLPTPEVVTQIIYQTPEWVKQLAVVLQQLAILALVFVPAFLASKAHNFVNPKLGKLGNSALLYGYSFVLGFLGLVAIGALNLSTIEWTNPAAVGAAFLAAVGSATVQYNRYKSKHPETDVVSPEDLTAATAQL